MLFFTVPPSAIADTVASENAFITEPQSEASRTFKKKVDLREMKQQYRRRYKKERLNIRRIRDDGASFESRQKDRLDREENAGSGKLPVLRGLTIKKSLESAANADTGSSVVKQDNYGLLSDADIESPMGILMKSIARTIRRIKNKARDGS